MSRRALLGSAAAAPFAAQVASAQSKPFKLRYAPRMGWVPGLTVPQQMEMYAASGFTAFEYNGLPNHPLQEVEAFRKKREELKLAMGVFVVNRGGWRPTTIPDKAAHRLFLEDVRKAVEIHKVMDNECATVTSGLAIPHVTYAQMTANCVEALKRAAEIVEKTKLVLVLEPLNHKVDHAGYFVVYMEHAAEIIGGVNHPQVKILMDMYHQQISEGNIINHLRHYTDFIGYYQTGDVPGRKEPGTGEMNYRNIFKAIHETGFKGIIGGEHGLIDPSPAGYKKAVEAYRDCDAFQI